MACTGLQTAAGSTKRVCDSYEGSHDGICIAGLRAVAICVYATVHNILISSLAYAEASFHCIDASSQYECSRRHGIW